MTCYSLLVVFAIRCCVWRDKLRLLVAYIGVCVDLLIGALIYESLSGCSVDAGCFPVHCFNNHVVLCRPSTCPVLKHGPRSLACTRVNGSYETLRRSESKSLRYSGVKVRSVFPRECSAAPTRPIPFWLGEVRAYTLRPERW